MNEIRPISAEAVIAVRWPVLRPGFARETAIFAGDELPTTRHLGAFRDGALAAVASIYLVSLPERPDAAPAWQLRGMATLPAHQGRGLGRDLLAACVAAARAAGGALLWCNARTSAAPFYAKFGWQIIGPGFDIPTVGPHFRMWREL